MRHLCLGKEKLVEKVSKELLKAASRLSGDPNFLEFLKWIRESKTVFHDELITSKDDRTLELQGIVPELNEVIDVGKNAVSKLKQLEETESRGPRPVAKPAPHNIKDWS
jgi:hypothetical protein